MATKFTTEELRRLRKNYNDRIRRANKRFEAASPEEKRVMIAKDVLEQLKLRKIKATPGEYLELDHTDQEKIDESKRSAELCDIFRTAKTCNACALGSVFMSAVTFHDKLKVKDFNLRDNDSGDMRAYLRENEIFSQRQLVMMENAFECTTIKPLTTEDGRFDYETNAKCIAFNDSNLSARRRLERIMKNIIQNNGTFVP